MANVATITPLNQFFDTNGSPLNSGYLYFGSVNQDPEQFPVQMYWDEAGTVPALQPIRTISGYPSRAGSPAIIYGPESYSLRVRNSASVQVLYAPSLGGLATAASLLALSTSLAASGGSSLVGFIQAGAGAVVRTVQAKLREEVNIKDFGAVGDGVTNDTTAITNFFNSAIANPGIPHVLESKTYAINAVLPTINVSNVQIIGQGAEIHDVGTLVTGTVLKWIGTTGTVGPLVKITSVSGASNQRISGIKFTGIGIDCNTGTINYGMDIYSIQESDIDVAIVNAAVGGLTIGVVATLGEGRDTQRNKIKLNARQVEAPAGTVLTCTGDATANTSMNEFWVDAQHKNTQAIYLINTDNNDWVFVRTFKFPGGTATEGVSILGGATAAEAARAERFHYYTANLPIHVYGTSGSPAFAAPSINNQIFCLDVENGTPIPSIEVGGSIHWRKDSSELADDAWTTYTPTVSASAGSITTSSATAKYRRIGNIVYLRCQITITTNGTGSGILRFTTPINSAGAIGASFAGKERAVTGKGVLGFLDGSGASLVQLQFYDGLYPGADGNVINVSGFYEV